MNRFDRQPSVARHFVCLAFLFCLMVGSGLAVAGTGNHTIIYSEDFESGFGDWAPTSGEWEVGVPTNGPGEAYAGSACAATSLGGNYAFAVYSRLQSPWISLPSDPADGALWMRIWQWFSLGTYDGYDMGKMQIYTDADGWVDLTTFYRSTINWSPWIYDLTDYSGMDVKFGLLIDDVDHGTRTSNQQLSGWYVDEFSVFDGAFPAVGDPESFEDRFAMDWDGWYSTGGVWQIGQPSHGCTSAGGWVGNCAGTVLDGNYPFNAYSMLISPPMELTATPRDGVLSLAFQQWCQIHNYDGLDYGRVKIWDGSAWTVLRVINYNLAHWSEAVIDISAYAGLTVRFGFEIDDNDAGTRTTDAMAAGWFIDDLALVEGRGYVDNPANCENLCPDWTTESGIWNIGVPTYGTTTTPSGQYCWGTNLSGQYPELSRDELKTPWISLPSAPTEPLELRFQHYHSLSTYDGTDVGYVRVHTSDGSATTLATISGTSGGTWSPYPAIDLSAYAGQQIKIGFVIQDVDAGTRTSNTEGAGWYLDDIEITGMTQSIPSDPIGLNMGITAGPGSLSWWHMPTDIQNVIVYGSPSEDFLPTYGRRLAVLDPSVTSYSDTDHQGWPALYYRISVVDINGHQSLPIYPMFISDVPDITSAGDRVNLKGISPNPFNPLTTVKFSTPRTGRAEVVVYDISGRVVRLLAAEVFTAGDHELQWDGRDNSGGRVSSGVYFCVVNSDDGRDSAKMTLVK